jgi:hypothetical protein
VRWFAITLKIRFIPLRQTWGGKICLIATSGIAKKNAKAGTSSFSVRLPLKKYKLLWLIYLRRNL